MSVLFVGAQNIDYHSDPNQGVGGMFFPCMPMMLFVLSVLFVGPLRLHSNPIWGSGFPLLGCGSCWRL